jgi:hypothetical protein
MSISTDLPGVAHHEVNERGCQIYRGEEADARIGIGPGTSRYLYDQVLCPLAWRQYDTSQDAYYFGTWVHIAERKVFSYTEDDRTLVIRPTANAFEAELRAMAEFYGPPPPAFVVIDRAGRVTKLYDQRPGPQFVSDDPEVERDKDVGRKHWKVADISRKPCSYEKRAELVSFVATFGDDDRLLIFRWRPGLMSKAFPDG